MAKIFSCDEFEFELELMTETYKTKQRIGFWSFWVEKQSYIENLQPTC